MSTDKGLDPDLSEQESQDEDSKLDIATGAIPKQKTSVQESKKHDSKSAVSDLSNAEIEMILNLRAMGLRPKIGSVDDIARLTSVFSKLKTGFDPEPLKPPPTSPPYLYKPDSHQYPKFSIFFGEEGKGEVNWDHFHFEVESVIHTSKYSTDQILFGIRRALKGSAGDKLRRLGPDASLGLVMKKLESAYGTIETQDSIMRKFYTCQQNSNESVESFASRLEEIHDKAVELNGLERADTMVLKQVLYSGLRKELKHMSVYYYEKDFLSYDDFKRQLRRLEAEVKSSESEKKPCKPAVPTERKEDSELKQILKQLSDRIEKLEKGKGSDAGHSISHSDRRRRRNWQQQSGDSRSGQCRKSHSNDPKAEDTFAPTCYLCNQKGHVQRRCPLILAQFVCTNCKTKGHLAKDCPNY